VAPEIRLALLAAADELLHLPKIAHGVLTTMGEPVRIHLGFWPSSPIAVRWVVAVGGQIVIEHLGIGPARHFDRNGLVPTRQVIFKVVAVCRVGANICDIDPILLAALNRRAYGVGTANLQAYGELGRCGRRITPNVSHGAR
jgi:hypothetical protein